MDKRFWNIYDRSYLFVVLSILLVLVYLGSCNFELQSVFFGPSKRQLIRAGALITSHIDRGELYRLCTSIFLHGDLLHLGLNTSAMWVLGRLCQTVYGGLRSFFVFFLSGLCGAMFSWTMGTTLTVGASGGLFGLIGALVVFGWKYKDEISDELGDLLRSRLFWVGILNLLLGLFLPMVDNPSHFGGFFMGIILGLMLGFRGDLQKVTSIEMNQQSDQQT